MRKRITALLVIAFILVTSLTGCGKQQIYTDMKAVNQGPLSICNQTFYEVFLYSYYDSNGDGIGDIQGLISKLDYLNDGNDETDTDLGVSGIWLMPVMPSDTYHKYDVKDYENIDPQYGTLADFQQLAKECHKRNIQLITDMVVNHTSSSHPWFTQAVNYLESLGEDEKPSAAVCRYLDYYHFTTEKTNSRYYPAGSSKYYYEAGFSVNMPELNLWNSDVRNEFQAITEFWFTQGVDGFRLDAVGEYETGNDTKSTEILSWFRQMVKEQNKDAYLVAEVWKGMDSYTKYYDSGVDSCFDFAFANADGIIASVLRQSPGYTAASYAQACVKIQDLIKKRNENAKDAPFYTNHDMGRSAGYYSGEYAKQRTMMAAAMNLFMSGTAFVYYGEELGMKGAGKDENKRAPMYWGAADTAGMCQGPPGMDTVKMKYPSLAEQQEDPWSVYSFYQEAIKLRNRFPAIALGNASVIGEMTDAQVCTIQKNRTDDADEQKILLVMNLSEKERKIRISQSWIQTAENPDQLCGMLLTKEGEIQINKVSAQNENGAEYWITLPGYSAAVLE